MHRSFQSKWFDKYTWLHYDEGKDSAYCFTCKTADEQNKLRTKYKDIAFISRGFNNWKDETVGFIKHEGSDCHKEAAQVIEVIPYETQNVGEQLCNIHASNKRVKRRMLLKILQNVTFCYYDFMQFLSNLVTSPIIYSYNYMLCIIYHCYHVY